MKKNIVIQEYIYNPFLYKGHKFDFRVYLFIASVDPLIVFYNEGFLWVSLTQYDINSDSEETHLTNTEISKKIIKEN